MQEQSSQRVILPLTGIAIAQISSNIEYLRVLGTSGPVLYPDNKITTERGGYIADSLYSLANNLLLYNILVNYYLEIKTLANRLVTKYSLKKEKNIELEDGQEVSILIAKINALFIDVITKKTLLEYKSPNGILDYNKLIHNGLPELLGSDLINDLSSVQIVLGDLSDSLLCALYSLPTPSVMLSLRAVEGMLRYAHNKLSNKPLSKEGWDQLQNEISSELKDRGIPLEELDGYLSYIRTKRNEAEHPNKRFTQKDAEDMLIHAKYAIAEINKILKRC
jgi:hypothetical protein